MAALISITHITRYTYDRPVEFGEHRLLVRPRDGHDLRVISAHLSISPPSTLRWHFDTFGNSVAHVHFSEAADHLEIRSDLLLKRYEQNALPEQQDSAQHRMPLAYSDENLIDLAPFIPMEFPSEREALGRWLDEAFPNRPTDVYGFLKSLSGIIHSALSYSRREERGTQSAMATIVKQTGTCRDFAFLFMECARFYGFAARFVTGYLHVQDRDDEIPSLTGGGSTHAWADIYVPGEGWMEFDPTNLIENNQALIRIDVTRTPYQATPISGTYNHEDGQFLGMFVSVAVRELQEDE